jgi:dephospho-CoA kinase
MIIIGLTGTLGAGKGTVVDYLVQNLGYKHYSVREFLTEEINKRGLPVNRDSMVLVANDLRAKHSPAYIVEQLYLRAKESGENCVIESIRTPGEVELLSSKENFHLLAIDADPGIRYQRIGMRNSETDSISYDEFLQNEEREMTSDDPNKQNLSRCIEMSEHTFYNNSTIDELYDYINKYLTKIINHG